MGQSSSSPPSSSSQPSSLSSQLGSGPGIGPAGPPEAIADAATGQGVDLLIFSRNRPMQLHALLHSLALKATGVARRAVLYLYDEPYAVALQEIRRSCADVEWIDECDFRCSVLDFVADARGYVAFMVDDNLLRKPVDFRVGSSRLVADADLLAFSLRLGLNLEYCYMLGRTQPVPDGAVRDGLFRWNWRQAVLDWAYPLSLDGHIFRSEQFLAWAQNLPFQKPNSLEAMLQAALRDSSLPPACSCFLESALIGIPLNRVQEEFSGNRSLGISPESLLERWTQGYGFDVEKISSLLPRSVHQPLQLPLVRRMPAGGEGARPGQP